MHASLSFKITFIKIQMRIQKGFGPILVAITNRNASALNFTSPSLPMLQAQVSLNLDNEVNEFRVSEYLLCYSEFLRLF